MWFPVDLPMPSEHYVLRTQTQQSTTPFTKGTLLPLSWRTIDTNSKMSGTQNGVPVTLTSYAKTIKRNTGIGFSPSSGLWFSALFNEDVTSLRSVPETGTYRVSGALEEFAVREVLARVGLDVNSSCTVGVALRGQSVKADILGSFSMAPDERTIYTGQRMGVAASTTISLQQTKVAIRYEAPVTGKVSIGGESKVSSAPGYLGGAVDYAQSTDLHVRGEWGVWEFAKNELGTPVLGPSKVRQTNILPLGLSVDARLVPVSVMGVGIRNAVGSSTRLETDLALGRLYYSNDTDMLPPKSIGDSDKGKMYSLRMGFAFDKADWESQLFFDYSTMKFSRTTDSNSLTSTLVQWGVGLRAGVEI
ncbi:hypothetical protein EBR21_12535 [bacterium]|nr:hypothetical protein [bacterium]